MSISKVEFKYRKPHLRYDADARTWIGYRVDIRAGKKRYRDTFRTRGEAERFVTDLRNRVVYKKAGMRYEVARDVAVKDLFAARVKQLRNPKEVIRATRIFRLFEETFEHPPRVSDVRKAHYQSYINSRLETGVKPETVDREITIISSAFGQGSVLFPHELEDFEPPTVVRPRTATRKRKRHVITETEKDAVVRHILTNRLNREYRQRTVSRPAIAWMFEIAWLIGLRFSEILALRKTDANRKSQTLKIRRGKTDDVQTMEYLPEQLFDILDAAAAASPTEYIVHLECSEHTFTRTIAEACQAVGIPYGRNNPEAVTFHGTRHSFTSRLSKVTDIATARDYTNHSSGVMVDYYSHPDPESKRQAMERMYGNGREKTLVEIFEKVRAGKMSKKAFLEALK